MMMVSAAEAMKGGDEESCALTVKEEVPADVGVPEITPLPESRVKPGGKLPLAMVQEYGGIPPEANNVKL